MPSQKHWPKVQYLHQTVTNPNIHIRGTHSYYSPAWAEGFEETVVRYHNGDAFSLKAWTPLWPVDQLRIGDYVCIGAESVILIGGNNTHRADWFSCYPHLDYIEEAYVGKGDTVIGDGAWLGMRSMIMPGVHIGEGAIIVANAVVTREVEPYSMVGGNPAKLLCHRFPEDIIARLLALRIYDWPEAKFSDLLIYMCDNDIDRLEYESSQYDNNNDQPESWFSE